VPPFFLGRLPPKQGDPPSQWNSLAEWCKTIITLGSALLGLTVTFSGPLLAKATWGQLFWLRASWVLLLLAIALGTISYMFVIAYLRSGFTSKEHKAVLCANLAFPALVLAGFAILVFGWISVGRAADPSIPKPEVHIHLAASPLSFEPVAQVGPFVTGKADALEAGAGSAGVSELVKTFTERGKGRELLYVLLVGSSDKFELGDPVKAEYGSNAGLARVRAEWVRERIAREISGRPFPALVLTVGPSRHGRHLSTGHTGPDRSVTVYAAWRDGAAAAPSISR
jgi:hypothetical protein